MKEGGIAEGGTNLRMPQLQRVLDLLQDLQKIDKSMFAVLFGSLVIKIGLLNEPSTKAVSMLPLTRAIHPYI